MNLSFNKMLVKEFAFCLLYIIIMLKFIATYDERLLPVTRKYGVVLESVYQDEIFWAFFHVMGIFTNG